LQAHGRQRGIGKRACAFHGAAEYLRKRPVLAVEVVGWEAVVVVMVWLGGVADEFVAGGWPGDRIVWGCRR
jgi:hypothetical protein